MLCFVSHVFVCFRFCLFSFFNTKIKIKKFEKLENTKTVCVLCTLVLVYIGWSLKNRQASVEVYEKQNSSSVLTLIRDYVF